MQCTNYLSISHSDGTVIDGRCRIHLDTPIRSVGDVELVSLEVNISGSLVTNSNNRLYFSEDTGTCLSFFCAELVPAEYDEGSLCRALQSAMACAKCISPGPEVSPSGPYSVFLSKTCNKLCIHGKSLVGFHADATTCKITEIEEVGAGVVAVRLGQPTSITRGACVVLHHPSFPSTTACVERAEEYRLFITWTKPGTMSGWMLYPASAKNNIATALGFVERDVSVGTPLMIHSMSAPTCFDGDTATVQVGFQSPHGLRVGDEVEFLHTRTSFELGVVSSTPSDHYVAVAVPIDSLLETEGMKIKLRKKSITVAENATCPRDGILRSYLHDQNVGVKLPCSAVILEGQQDIAHEWKHGSATVYRDTSQRLCLEMPYPRHLMFRAGHSMIRKRGQVVADRPLDLSLPFMFFRLWLGRVECMGIKRPSMPSVFARVQLRDGKRCFVNSSDAVVGRVEITPQMDKVSWLEVEAIDARGMPLAATWSMLLRFEGSSIPISHERIS